MTRSLTRRSFNRLAAAAALAPLARGQDPAPRHPPGRFVDVHTHLGQAWGARPTLTADLLLRWMDAHEVAQAVVLPLISPEAWDHPISTDYVLRETQPHRDRLLPFCSIDPRTTLLGGVAKKRDLLARYRDAGALGCGEHKPGVAVDHPGNLELFRACADLGLPLLLHLDTIRNTDAPGLPGLARVLEEVPDGVFIMHAQGWWASISGDVTGAQLQQYPGGPVAPGGAVDALMDRFPNLYGDLSAGSGHNAIARDPAFGRDFVVRRADRLLFGTDYLTPEQAVKQFTLYESMDLPDEVRAKVYRGNARRLLGLD